MQFAKKFLYTESEFAETYRFAVVRNPYIRAVSCWIYLTKNWGISKPRNMLAKRSFNYFLQMLPELWEERWDRHVSTHTAPIWADITDEDGQILLSDVYKLETLSQEYSTLCDKLEIQPRDLAHTNSSNIDDYKQYLNRKSIQFIEDLYGDDIRNLSYDFPY